MAGWKDVRDGGLPKLPIQVPQMNGMPFGYRHPHKMRGPTGVANTGPGPIVQPNAVKTFWHKSFRIEQPGHRDLGHPMQFNGLRGRW